MFLGTCLQLTFQGVSMGDAVWHPHTTNDRRSGLALTQTHGKIPCAACSNACCQLDLDDW